MLTEAQKGVIERIPTQGALEYDYSGKAYRFTQEQVDEAVQQSFEGKTPPAVKKARIMMGAPGVGKTRFAQEWYEDLPPAQQQNTIFIGYNEGGAEEHFSPFVEAMEEASDDYEKRLQVTNQFQQITQRIQNETQRRALREEFSLLIDITAERKGAGLLIDALKGAGYNNIELVGLHAPFHIARSRSEERPRPTAPYDIVHKRTGVLGFLRTHAEKCSHFEFYTNSYDDLVPVRAFYWDPPSLPADVDKQILQKVCDDLTQDISDVRQYLKEIRKRPDCKKLVDVDVMMTAYQEAAQIAQEFFQDVMRSDNEHIPEPFALAFHGK